MIVAIVNGGRSKTFGDALGYVLGPDKDGNERVGETQAVNLISAPEKAHKEMQVTVDAAKAIQARARMERGERAGGSGSRAEKACFHYALSWSPLDAPTPEQMFKFAHLTLERLGLTEHQAVIVQHVEKNHPHLHVVANTVHPETGRNHGLYQSAYILDRCAHEYEKGMNVIRTFNRDAKYAREKDWKKEPDKERKAEYDKRRRELSEVRTKAADALKQKQAERREAHQKKVDEVRRNAEIDKHNLKQRHQQQINEYWRNQAPKMSVDPRPSASFTRPLETEATIMAKALKGLSKTTYHSSPAEVERKKVEAKVTFDRAKASETSLQPPSPNLARSEIHSQFRDRSENSRENQLAHHDVTDRYDGAEQIKRWQRHELDEIDRRAKEMIALLKADRVKEIERNEREWKDHKEIHDRLRDEVRREFGLDQPEKEPAKHVNNKRPVEVVPAPESRREKWDRQIAEINMAQKRESDICVRRIEDRYRTTTSQIRELTNGADDKQLTEQQRVSLKRLQVRLDVEQNLAESDWAKLGEKYHDLENHARRDAGLPSLEEQTIIYLDHDWEKTEPVPRDGAKNMEEPLSPMRVQSYVDDYVAGRGRDSVEHEQFAANNAQDIEEEFQRSATEPQAEPPAPEPDPVREETSYEHDEPPPLEPDMEFDREYGD